MDRELEFLRQQIDYLDRMLETCLARIGSLEMQVAELKRRPVLLVQEERQPAPPDLGSVEQMFVLDPISDAWVCRPRTRF